MVAEKGILLAVDIVFKAVVGALVVYFMNKFKQMEEKTEKMVNAEEVHKIIDRRLEALDVRIKEMKEDQAEVKSDIKYLVSKIDRLVERL